MLRKETQPCLVSHEQMDEGLYSREVSSNTPQKPDGVQNLDSFVVSVSSLAYLLKNFQFGSFTRTSIESMNHSNWILDKVRIFWKSTSSILNLPFSNQIQQKVSTIFQLLTSISEKDGVVTPRVWRCRRRHREKVWPE